MAIDRGIIGSRSPEFSTVAEPGRLRSFALATGATESVYTDAATARAAGHRDLPIPPTFLFCRDGAHDLDASRDSDVVLAGYHACRRLMDGLLGRAALAVDGQPWHGFGPVGGQDRCAADAAGLHPDAGSAAQDHIVDAGWVQAGALGEGGKDMGGE